MKKIILIKEDGNRMPCVMEIPEHPRRIAIVLHGFTSSKESPTVQLLLRRLPMAGIGVFAYDQPAHGQEESAGEELRIEGCKDSLQTAENYVTEHWSEAEICYFGSSFGAYIIALYLSTRPHRGRRAFFRSAAVNMPKLFIKEHPTPEEQKLLHDLETKGYMQPSLELGSPVKVTQGMIDDLAENDLFEQFKPHRYGPHYLRMAHGRADTVIDPKEAERFSKQFQIPAEFFDGEGHSLSNDPAVPERIADMAIELFSGGDRSGADPARLTDEEYDRILSVKRDLHMHPELALEEYRTTQKIREFLEEIPEVEILPLPVPTGIIAQIRGDRNDAEIMLRADIDALPQTEQYDSPWKSQTDGRMHACGHDFHTAALLGAALILARAKRTGKLHRTVDLVFQPAEEGTRGARRLIDAGLFERIHPDLCFGLHNWPSVPTGSIICHEGALMSAKRNFEIHIQGHGGHGSMPHLNTDPIVCAAAVIQSLQTVISRNMNPIDSAILSVNRIEGGSAANLVADHVRMSATVRSLSETALDRALERVDTIVARTAEAYECCSEIIWEERIPSVWNTPGMTDTARACAGKTGCTVTDTVPSLASEDFALYRAHVPSFFYWVGSTAPGDRVEELHRPGFHTDDAALRYAAELYAVSALEAVVQSEQSML